MEKHCKATVLGGGSFGTAIANILADNGHDVSLWMRNQQSVDEILTTNENTRYLPGYKLNKKLKASTDIATTLENADVVFIAVPSKSALAVIHQCNPYLNDSSILVSTTKGIQENGFTFMSQLLEEHTSNQSIGVLSGPNLAKEIAARKLTGTVIASKSEYVRNRIQKLLSCSYFRVYGNSDVYGVELAGALKNIYAIAAGMATAMAAGENTKSMLITRSLAEMSRLAAKLGANPFTFLGLAGVGDLFATCTSPLSRNFQVGFNVGKGLSLDQTLENLEGTAEGINTIRIVKQKADEMRVNMPLVQGLHAILFEGAEQIRVLKKLLLTENTADVEFMLPQSECN